MNIYNKLRGIQQEITPIAKDKTNPHFKSKYFDINDILGMLRPLWNKYNIIVIQPLCNDNNGAIKLNTIIIDIDSESKMEYSITLLQNDDPQKMGSLITYFRRYSLVSLFCLEADDDDANTARGVNTSTNTDKKLIAESLMKDTHKPLSNTQKYASTEQTNSI